MRIVIAIDSFKGSLTSYEAGNSIADGIRSAMPDANITIRPLADGGEGTVAALTAGNNGIIKNITVTGPVGRPVKSMYGILNSNGSSTAVIEMAKAAGITLVPADSPADMRNPLYTTTYGVGELIKDAINEGCRDFIIGIGGSATNDGGIGMLQALGFGMLDDNGCQVPFGAIGLKNLKSITTDNALPELSECTFRIACDVTNPLCGASGCSAVFGPQKGATPQMIADMDTWLAHYADIAGDIAGMTSVNADACFPGSGAAGGLGFAFHTFLNASLESGTHIILEATNLREYIRTADIVVTGEGRLDSQTVMGKAPAGVAAIAKEYGIPVIAFCGCASDDAGVCNDNGIDAFFPILTGITTLEEAMSPDTARLNASATAKQVFRLIKALSYSNNR